MSEQLPEQHPENTPIADPEDPFAPEGDPEITPFEGPFETPPVPGESP
jgi:hypothetical protein